YTTLFRSLLFEIEAVVAGQAHLVVGLGLRRFDPRGKREPSRHAARDPPGLELVDGRLVPLPARFVAPADRARTNLDSRDVQAHRPLLRARLGPRRRAPRQILEIG